MILSKAVEWMKQYATCPKCGSNHIGNGEGGIEVNGNMFIRTCKCGFKIEVTEKENENE